MARRHSRVDPPTLDNTPPTMTDNDTLANYSLHKSTKARQHAVEDEKPANTLEVALAREQAQNTASNAVEAASLKEGDDHALIAECCAGDKQAFDVLLLRHQNSVFTLATRLLADHHEAEDITQDTFLRAYEGIEEFRGAAKFSTWLYRICHNLCLNHLKRKKNDPTNDAGEETVPEELPDPRSRPPDQVLISREREHLVTQALSPLAPEFREVLRLHHTCQFSYQEIAELLELPVGTVRSRLHRGREEVKEYLRSYLQEGG